MTLTTSTAVLLLLLIGQGKRPNLTVLHRLSQPQLEYIVESSGLPPASLRIISEQVEDWKNELERDILLNTQNTYEYVGGELIITDWTESPCEDDYQLLSRLLIALGV